MRCRPQRACAIHWADQSAGELVRARLAGGLSTPRPRGGSPRPRAAAKARPHAQRPARENAPGRGGANKARDGGNLLRLEGLGDALSLGPVGEVLATRGARRSMRPWTRPQARMSAHAFVRWRAGAGRRLYDGLGPLAAFGVGRRAKLVGPAHLPRARTLLRTASDAGAVCRPGLPTVGSPVYPPVVCVRV